MTTKKRGLGAGLGAFLPDEIQQRAVREVPVDRIRENPRQPRMRFDEAAIDELAASIGEHGVIQPLIVTEPAPGEYELIAGERRWRAAQRAGLTRVPVIVRESTPQQVLELALIENVQRADLNPLEEAQAFQALKDEFGLSDEQIARRLGITSRVTVTNTRRLLQLPDEVKSAILNNQISAGHGRAILKIDAPDQQAIALRAIIERDMSVREAERLCALAADLGGDVPGALDTLYPAQSGAADGARRVSKRGRQRAQADEARLSPDDEAIQREMADLLGTPVRLTRAERELRVTITFYDEEKLQEFFDLLNGTR
nr:MAG: chromosome partitioning protein ParB [Chloroflexota bacterium]